MNVSLNPSEESSNHKVAASFAAVADAEEAARRLRASDSLQSARLDVLKPGASNVGRTLLPESEGIWKTWLKAHAVFGALGAVAGLAAYLGLMAMGVGVIESSPVLSAVVLVHVAAMMGLLAGGLVSFRPDQTAFFHSVQDALRDGKAVLIFHAESKEQQRSARSDLDDATGQVFATV